MASFNLEKNIGFDLQNHIISLTIHPYTPLPSYFCLNALKCVNLFLFETDCLHNEEWLWQTGEGSPMGHSPEDSTWASSTTGLYHLQWQEQLQRAFWDCRASQEASRGCKVMPPFTFFLYRYVYELFLQWPLFHFGRKEKGLKTNIFSNVSSDAAIICSLLKVKLDEVESKTHFNYPFLDIPNEELKDIRLLFLRWLRMISLLWSFQA